MIDTNTIIRSYLDSQTAITAIIGKHLYVKNLPRDFTVKQPAISFLCRGGPSEVQIPVVMPSVQFKCWGTTPEEAREVYRALFDALDQKENQIVGSDRIFFIEEEVQGQDLTDPDSKWDYVLAFFSFKILND